MLVRYSKFSKIFWNGRESIFETRENTSSDFFFGCQVAK